jgi:hypothetical protein
MVKDTKSEDPGSPFEFEEEKIADVNFYGGSN